MLIVRVQYNEPVRVTCRDVPLIGRNGEQTLNMLASRKDVQLNVQTLSVRRPAWLSTDGKPVRFLVLGVFFDRDLVPEPQAIPADEVMVVGKLWPPARAMVGFHTSFLLKLVRLKIERLSNSRKERKFVFEYKDIPFLDFFC